MRIFCFIPENVRSNKYKIFSISYSGQKGARCKASAIRPVKYTVVLICTVQKKLVYSGSVLSPALRGVMWSRDVPLLHPSHSPPTPHPSHFLLSLQAALWRDGLGWSRPRSSLTAKSMISRCRMIRVCIAVYFHYNYFLWSTPQMSFLLSIDCYCLFRFINHKIRMKTSACINHIPRLCEEYFKGWEQCLNKCYYLTASIKKINNHVFNYKFRRSRTKSFILFQLHYKRNKNTTKFACEKRLKNR